MTVRVLLLGEYDPNTELYIKTLIADECVFDERTFSDHVSSPCPEEYVATDSETMNEWAFTYLIEHGSIDSFDLVMPYSTVLNNLEFKVLFKPGLDRVHMADCLPQINGAIKLQSFNLRISRLPNSFLFDSVRRTLQLDSNCKLITIPSIIHVDDAKRSVFSSTERLDQTVRQINSIRKYVKNAKIVVLEISKLSALEMSRLAYIADVVWTFDDDRVLQKLAADPNKNKAELYVLGKFWRQYADSPNITHYAKFGGRYWFSRYVNDSLFKNDEAVMKQVFAKCYNQYIIEPVFYSVPRRDVSKFIEFTKRALMVMETQFTDNERLLYDLYASREDIHVPVHMNIQGYMATTGVFRHF